MPDTIMPGPTGETTTDGWEISVNCVCGECEAQTYLAFFCDLGLGRNEWGVEISNGVDDPNPKQMVINNQTLLGLHAWLQQLKDKGRI